jgi:hypothetical protein
VTKIGLQGAGVVSVICELIPAGMTRGAPFSPAGFARMIERAGAVAVDAGGLMSYSATTSEINTTAAEQVAKILDGARPSELPLRRRPVSSWSSTTRLRRGSDSQFQRRCWSESTRLSNRGDVRFWHKQT